MDNLEKQLNRLPKARLGAKADASLRFKLHKAIWQDRIADFRVWLSPSPRLSAAFLILIFLITAITVPVYAYASSSVTNEHFLYPLKQTVEKIELRLSLSPESKAETLVKISNHRLDEAVALSKEKNNEALQKSLNEAVILNQKAQDELLKVKNDSGVKIDEIIESAKEGQIKKLENVAVNIGAEADDDVIEDVAVAMDFVRGYDRKKKEGLEYKENNFNSFPETRDKNEEASSLAESSQDEKQETADNNKDGKSDVQKKNLNNKVVPQKQNKKALENNLAEMKKGVEVLKNDLKKEELEESDVKLIVEKLDSRVEKVKNLIKEDQLDDADTVLKSTQAIKNNAKSFIKKDKSFNFQNESKDNDNKGFHKKPSKSNR